MKHELPPERDDAAVAEGYGRLLSPAPSDLWAYFVTDWPLAAAGITQRGPHQPEEACSGYNLGHTAQANHRRVEALRRRAIRELLSGLPESAWQESHIALVGAQQRHSAHVAVVKRTDLASQPRFWGTPYYEQCDALITQESGLVLMLLYADCCPIVLYSPEPLCGGVVHAGWRGTLADIAGRTVRALQEHFGAAPENMQALVGPCIGVECYEVGPEVLVQAYDFCQARKLPSTLCRHFVRQKQAPPEHAFLDLLGMNSALLQQAGVPAENIRCVPYCTSCGPVPLFSWRRDGPQTGRIAAFFVLTKELGSAEGGLSRLES